MPSPATIRLQPQDQGSRWETIGVERYRGIVPESIRPSANGWGPDALGFTLKRRPGAIFPDLSTWTPAELEIAGAVVWDGWLKEAPEQDGDSFQIGVVGAGWQYHLDEDTYFRPYAHNRVGDLVDTRTYLGTDLTRWIAAGLASVDSRGIASIVAPNGTSWAANKTVGVFLDLGEGQDTPVKRVVVTFDLSNNNANFTFACEAGDTPDFSGTGETIFSVLLNSGASQTGRGTATTARRYLRLYINNSSGATQVPAADVWAKIKTIQIFRSTAYESGDASILKTDALVKDALTFAPLLSQDTSQIATPPSGFNWPSFNPDDEKTPREIIEAANAAERMQPRLRIGKQLQYRAFPTLPLFEVGEWPGSQFKDTSAGSGQDVYSKAKVKGTGPDGAKLTVVRTQVGTILDRFGRTRTKVLPLSLPINSALGNQLGDAFLSVHRTMPLKGELAVEPGGARWLAGGGIHPAHLLLHTGEKLRLSHRIDPDTGGWGRDGQIAQVVYDHDTETAQVSIDNERDNFQALLERMGAVLGSGR